MAYGFRCSYIGKWFGFHNWRMSWVVDHVYPNSRLRYPRHHAKVTEDINAAKRFCKKHDLQFPEPTVNPISRED